MAANTQHQWGLISLLAQSKALRRRLQDEGDELYSFRLRNEDDWTEARDRTDEEKEEQEWVRRAVQDRMDLIHMLNRRRVRALRRSLNREGFSRDIVHCTCPLGHIVQGQVRILVENFTRIGMDADEFWENEWIAEA